MCWINSVVPLADVSEVPDSVKLMLRQCSWRKEEPMFTGVESLSTTNALTENVSGKLPNFMSIGCVSPSIFSCVPFLAVPTRLCGCGSQTKFISRASSWVIAMASLRLLPVSTRARLRNCPAGPLNLTSVLSLRVPVPRPCPPTLATSCGSRGGGLLKNGEIPLPTGSPSPPPGSPPSPPQCCLQLSSPPSSEVGSNPAANVRVCYSGGRFWSPSAARLGVLRLRHRRYRLRHRRYRLLVAC